MSGKKINKVSPKRKSNIKKNTKPTDTDFDKLVNSDSDDDFNIDFWKSYIITQQELVNDLVKKNMILTTEINKLNQVLQNYQKLLNDSKGVQTINREEQHSRIQNGKKVLHTFKPNKGLTIRTGLSKISKE